MHESYFQAVFTWGKYKGHTLASVLDLAPKYLTWVTNTPGIPEVWRTACQRALVGESVEDLVLPRVKLSADKKTIEHSYKGTIEVSLKDNKTAYIVMPYNQTALASFKYEIDGRKWNGEEKCWEFPSVNIPKVVKLFPECVLSPDAKKLHDKLVSRRDDLDELRVKEDIDFDIPGMHLNLYGYQKIGVKFVERAGGRCLIADAPGLGKTAQAIGFAQLNSTKTLIVCPLSVVINWKKEIKKFTGKSAVIWDSKGYEGHLNGQFHITHYDAAAKNHQWLKDQGFELLVCDEATMLKNRKTIRAKAILGSWKERRKFPGIKTKYSIFLTGTPVMSRPIEAFSLLNFLDKERFNNFYHFVERYGGWRGEAPKNLQDLHDRTKDLVIRRKKSEVLKELPNKQRNDLYVELTKDERTQYNKLLKEMFGHWKMEGKPSVKHMPKLQGFLIEKKLPRVIEMIDEFLDNNRSILIFSNYIAPLKMLNAHYGDKSAMLTGQMKKADRQESIDKLSNGTAKVGLFSLMAAGMGIDGLQHQISTVVFLNMDFVPANHEQAEDRTHRIGQKGQVQVYYMVCEDSIDEYMRELLQEKQKIADMIVDGALITPANNKSFFKEFVKKINLAYTQNFDQETIVEDIYSSSEITL